MKLFYITLLALFAVICCYDDLMRYGKITNTIIPRNPTTLSNVSYGCQTFLSSNLYLGGRVRPSVLFKGKLFQATTSTRISKLQLNLNFKPYCNEGENCSIPKTCKSICTIGAMSVLLVVARAGYNPDISAISPATGNNLTPNSFFDTVFVDYVLLSGPLYQFPNDVIYAKTFHLDNENTNAYGSYELNYCNSIDERVKEIKLDAGDRIFLLVYYTTNYDQFHANSRMLFIGNFNWELAYP